MGVEKLNVGVNKNYQQLKKENEQLGIELSEREIQEIIQGIQISELEIQLLELQLGGV